MCKFVWKPPCRWDIVHGAWELGSHEAEIHTGQSVHFSVHFSLNRYVSFQFSSRCSKVKGSPSDPERLGKWLNTAFWSFIVWFSLIICKKNRPTVLNQRWNVFFSSNYTSFTAVQMMPVGLRKAAFLPVRFIPLLLCEFAVCFCLLQLLDRHLRSGTYRAV